MPSARCCCCVVLLHDVPHQLILPFHDPEPTATADVFMGACPEPYGLISIYSMGMTVEHGGIVYVCVSLSCGSNGSDEPGKEKWAVVGYCASVSEECAFVSIHAKIVENELVPPAAAERMLIRESVVPRSRLFIPHHILRTFQVKDPLVVQPNLPPPSRPRPSLPMSRLLR